MTELDQALVRRLAEWTPGDAPVTSLYLSVDGRRLPRKVDYELRLDEALRRVRDLASNLDKRARGSVEGDCAAILAFVRERFERGSTRGLALFSSSSNVHFEAVLPATGTYTLILSGAATSNRAYAFRVTLAIEMRRLGEQARLLVGNEGGDAGARPRDDADD